MSRYKMKAVGACMAAALMMAGCGQTKVPDAVEVTSIAITDKGEVTSYLVEAFDKEYYDLSELTSMANSEVAEYNAENQQGETIPVVVEKVEVLENDSSKVRLIQKYSSTDVFMDYNESVLYYGTVEDAVNAGYDLDIVLKSVKDSTLLSKEQLLQETDKYLLVTDENAVIYCPKKVTYVSEGAVYREDGTVDATQTEGITVILMKK